jgi:3-hydroxyisobutyrate dehydrogenase-like beta-hydroxyacid dehydrogenase
MSGTALGDVHGVPRCVSYLGVGNMGRPMAGKLLDAGHNLSIYDAREGAMRPLLERQARGLNEGVGGHMGYGHCLSTLEIFQRALSGPDGLLAGKALKTLVNTCTVNPQQRNRP